MTTEKRLMDAYLNDEVPKIKTHFAEIIVRGQTEKPYYNIIFIDPQTREYEVCFGSYSLENVRKWLSEKFEIIAPPTVDAVEVIHGHWFSLTDCSNAGVYCSVCNKKVWKEDYAWCNRKNKLRSNYCPNCGAKMDGGN